MWAHGGAGIRGGCEWYLSPSYATLVRIIGDVGGLSALKRRSLQLRLIQGIANAGNAQSRFDDLAASVVWDDTTLKTVPAGAPGWWANSRRMVRTAAGRGRVTAPRSLLRVLRVALRGRVPARRQITPTAAAAPDALCVRGMAAALQAHVLRC